MSPKLRKLLAIALTAAILAVLVDAFLKPEIHAKILSIFRTK